MKKLFFITATVLFSLNVFSQGLNFKQKINTNDLIGYWVSSNNSASLFFWKDFNNELQVQEINNKYAEPLELISFTINTDSVMTDTRLNSTNSIIESIYSFINKITLKCTYVNYTNGKLVEDTIYYTKIK